MFHQISKGKRAFSLCAVALLICVYIQQSLCVTPFPQGQDAPTGNFASYMKLAGVDDFAAPSSGAMMPDNTNNGLFVSIDNDLSAATGFTSATTTPYATSLKLTVTEGTGSAVQKYQISSASITLPANGIRVAVRVQFPTTQTGNALLGPTSNSYANDAVFAGFLETANSGQVSSASVKYEYYAYYNQITPTSPAGNTLVPTETFGWTELVAGVNNLFGFTPSFTAATSAGQIFMVDIIPNNVSFSMYDSANSFPQMYGMYRQNLLSTKALPVGQTGKLVIGGIGTKATSANGAAYAYFDWIAYWTYSSAATSTTTTTSPAVAMCSINISIISFVISTILYMFYLKH